MTLIELSIGAGLLLMVTTALLSLVSASQNNLEREISRTTTNDSVRLAVESIDREVRSGNVLYDPSTEVYAPGDVAAGMSIRVYTQSNYATRGESRCVQWRITTAGVLQTRNWSKDWKDSPSTLVTGWRNIASGVMNRTDGLGAAFSVSNGNLITVDFRVNDDPTGKKGATVELKQKISGRNTTAYTGAGPQWTQICGSTPPDPALTGSDGSQVPAY